MEKMKRTKDHNMEKFIEIVENTDLSKIQKQYSFNLVSDTLVSINRKIKTEIKDNNVNTAINLIAEKSAILMYFLKEDPDLFDRCANHPRSPLKHRQNTKLIMQRDKKGSLISIYSGTIECELLGFHRSGISNCCTGKIQRYCGFIWEFYDSSLF